MSTLEASVGICGFKPLSCAASDVTGVDRPMFVPLRRPRTEVSLATHVEDSPFGLSTPPLRGNRPTNLTSLSSPSCRNRVVGLGRQPKRHAVLVLLLSAPVLHLHVPCLSPRAVVSVVRAVFDLATERSVPETSYSWSPTPSCTSTCRGTPRPGKGIGFGREG